MSKKCHVLFEWPLSQNSRHTLKNFRVKKYLLDGVALLALPELELFLAVEGEDLAEVVDVDGSCFGPQNTR